MTVIIIFLVFIVLGLGVVVYFLLNEGKKNGGKQEVSQAIPIKKQEEVVTMEQKLKCSQCGLDFPAAEIITYENHYVCGGCKTAFVQRLREGVSLSATTKFAGFWIRAGAIIIDGIILAVVNWSTSLLIYHFFGKPHLVPGSKQLDLGTGYYLALFVNMAFGFGYNVWFLGKYGATLGKMACGIKVIMADGRKISYGRAFGRYWAYILSGFTLCIGYIMAGVDKEKRALHDRICNTRVIYK